MGFREVISIETNVRLFFENINIDFLVSRNTITTLQQPHLSQDTVDNILFCTMTVRNNISKCVLGPQPQSQTWKLRGCVFIVYIHFPLSSLSFRSENADTGILSIS